MFLAAAFTAFAVIDTTSLHIASELRQVTFDAMVRYRIRAPKPDPDIVIVDINEASLSAMSQGYGRWPWPRQVLGEFVEHIEKQHPKAVVFDILFSDADVYNPDSDAYFDAAVAATDNTYFPMLRLDPADDSRSQIKPGLVPGVEPMPGEKPDASATVAVILPHFQSALGGGRLGTHNVYPDSDGVTRRYPVYGDSYGWKIPSLPARIGRDLGWPEPAVQSMLLNWHGKAFSYHYVSFSDVYFDMLSKVKRRPQDEFSNKIVLIGSTAPSLFDLKATPLARAYPGVEVLATAIDNVKHGDAIRSPEGNLWQLLVTLAIVWLTALAFYRNAGRDRIDGLFGLSQFLLILLSYASINFTNTYINLTGPVTVGLIFFTVARTYASATRATLENSLAAHAAAPREGKLHATLLLIRFDAERNPISNAVLKKIRRQLAKSGACHKSAEILGGEQKGIWSLFENTIAMSWVVDAADEAAIHAVQRDVEAMELALAATVRRTFLHPEHAESHIIFSSPIAGDSAHAGWRLMFAEALMAWERKREAIA